MKHWPKTDGNVSVKLDLITECISLQTEKIRCLIAENRSRSLGLVSNLQ